MENSTATGFTRRREDIEMDIRKAIISFTSAEMLPADFSNLSFEHRLPISLDACIKIHVSCKPIRGGDTAIKGVLIPKDAQHNDMEKTYVIATCVIERPRA